MILFKSFHVQNVEVMDIVVGENDHVYNINEIVVLFNRKFRFKIKSMEFHAVCNL